MDRKGWLIIGVCLLLIYLNSQWGAGNREEIADQAAKEQAAADASNEEVGQLKAVDPPESEYVEETHTLETPNAIFTLSSLNGGIVGVELKDELVVGGTDKVIVNSGGAPQVGAISSAPDAYIERGMTIASADEKSIVFTGKAAGGMVITKTYTVLDDSKAGHAFMLDLSVQMQLPADAAATNLANYAISLGTAAPTYTRETLNHEVFFYHADGDLETDHVGEFKGSMWNSEKETIVLEDESVSMAGVMSQFFATIIKQSEPRQAKMWFRNGTKEMAESEGGGTKDTVRGAFGLPQQTLSPGDSITLDYAIYMGPKHKPTLADLGDDYRDVMDYGWFSFISRPFNAVLNWLHDTIYGGISPIWGWGWAIVTLTILIRLAIWPLHNKSQRTMKKMSKLQPKMKELREKYADNPNKMNQETMKLYQTYGINPLGGCLPMLAQIPIFFGFYKMLMFAVELRGESFMWVDDLSQPDTLFHVPLGFADVPFNLLPFLMAITMVIQMRMTPSTGDKMQRIIFMLMPLMFFFFCYNFASALALYWTTQNIFSIGQTYLMQRRPEPELVKSTKPRKKTMAERMAEMQEQQKQMRRAQGRELPGDKDKSKKRRPRTGG